MIRAPLAAWLLAPLAIASGNVLAQRTLAAPMVRPVAPSSTMLLRPRLAPDLQVARAAGDVQARDAAIDGAQRETT